MLKAREARLENNYFLSLSSVSQCSSAGRRYANTNESFVNTASPLARTVSACACSSARPTDKSTLSGFLLLVCVITRYAATCCDVQALLLASERRRSYLERIREELLDVLTHRAEDGNARGQIARDNHTGSQTTEREALAGASSRLETICRTEWVRHE